jgi:hypothetical protein
MLVALQAHTKHILTSASIKIWGAKSETMSEITTKRPMLDAIINKPNWLAAELAVDWAEGYQVSCSRFLRPLFIPNSCALHRTGNLEFHGCKNVEFNVISRRASVYGDGRPTVEEIGYLAALLGSKLLSNRFSVREIETLKSLIILVTFLSEIHDLMTVYQILLEVLSTYKITSSHIFVWSTIEEVAGFKRLAAEAIECRLRKWGVPRLPGVYNWNIYMLSKRRRFLSLLLAKRGNVIIPSALE